MKLILALLMLSNVCYGEVCFEGANSLTYMEAEEISRDKSVSEECLGRLKTLHWDNYDYSFRKKIRENIKTNLYERELDRLQRLNERKAEKQRQIELARQEKERLAQAKIDEDNQKFADHQNEIIKNKLGEDYESLRTWLSKVLQNTKDIEGPAAADDLAKNVDTLISKAQELQQISEAQEMRMQQLEAINLAAYNAKIAKRERIVKIVSSLIQTAAIGAVWIAYKSNADRNPSDSDQIGTGTRMGNVLVGGLCSAGMVITISEAF